MQKVIEESSSFINSLIDWIFNLILRGFGIKYEGDK
jgi:hypothetical protein